jgi:hypothetical protein
MRLQSATCDAQVIVVKGANDVDVRCGGRPMVPVGEAVERVEGDAAHSGGTLLGKRYADDDAGVELLCTKAGASSLSIGDAPLPVKGTKALPASD